VFSFIENEGWKWYHWRGEVVFAGDEEEVKKEEG
jgi:hypothetical protein